MPLRAYIGNEEIISIDLDEKQWEDLKKLVKSKMTILTLPCCKQQGFLRTSNKGLRHFVHARSKDTCDWKPESAEHLKAKTEVIEACKENGWKAIPEFSETNWRADVLAIQNEKRIAFEVQWSRQTFVDTDFRQNRYKDSNVRGCWFFRTAPKELREHDDTLKALKEIPAFKIFKDENSNIIAQLKQTQMPLKSLVDSLLKGQLKYCEHVRLKPRQEATIVFFETTCWKCDKPQHLWTVEQNFISVCNQGFYLIGTLRNHKDIDKSPQVYNAVKKFLQTGKGNKLKIGQLKNRYSKTIQDSYLSHGCFYCDAIFGDWFLNIEKMDGISDPNSTNVKVEIEFDEFSDKGNHWCYSENGEFCE